MKRLAKIDPDAHGRLEVLYPLATSRATPVPLERQTSVEAVLKRASTVCGPPTSGAALNRATVVRIINATLANLAVLRAA
jgi:hypothetical protein